MMSQSNTSKFSICQISQTIISVPAAYVGKCSYLDYHLRLTQEMKILLGPDMEEMRYKFLSTQEMDPLIMA